MIFNSFITVHKMLMISAMMEKVYILKVDDGKCSRMNKNKIKEGYLSKLQKSNGVDDPSRKKI